MQVVVGTRGSRLALTQTEEVVARLGSLAELKRVGALLREGPSYRRQRRLYEETGRFSAVVEALVREFRGSIR